jgi:hypothetical protein
MLSSPALLTTIMRQASPLDESLTQHMYNLSSALQCPSHTLDAAHLTRLCTVVGGSKHPIIISAASIRLPSPLFA